MRGRLRSLMYNFLREGARNNPPQGLDLPRFADTRRRRGAARVSSEENHRNYPDDEGTRIHVEISITFGCSFRDARASFGIVRFF